MAKKKATRKSNDSGINKTALIREVLTKTPDASPTAVAAEVGHGVTPGFVSTIKTNMRAAKKNTAKGKPVRAKKATRATSKAVPTVGALDPAIAFIEAAGSLEAAKQQIETIERIKRL